MTESNMTLLMKAFTQWHGEHVFGMRSLSDEQKLDFAVNAWNQLVGMYEKIRKDDE